MCKPPRKRSNPLEPQLSAAKKEPSPEIDSSPKHRMSSKVRSFTENLPVMGVKIPEKQQCGKAFLSHVNEWLVKAMSTHCLAKSAQLSICFRSVLKFSVLSSSGAYNWNDSMLRIFEVMLCVFFGASASRFKKRRRVAEPCSSAMCRQRTRESGSFASLP